MAKLEKNSDVIIAYDKAFAPGDKVVCVGDDIYNDLEGVITTILTDEDVVTTGRKCEAVVNFFMPENYELYKKLENFYSQLDDDSETGCDVVFDEESLWGIVVPFDVLYPKEESVSKPIWLINVENDVSSIENKNQCFTDYDDAYRAFCKTIKTIEKQNSAFLNQKSIDILSAADLFVAIDEKGNRIMVSLTTCDLRVNINELSELASVYEKREMAEVVEEEINLLCENNSLSEEEKLKKLENKEEIAEIALDNLYGVEDYWNLRNDAISDAIYDYDFNKSIRSIEINESGDIE